MLGKRLRLHPDGSILIGLEASCYIRMLIPYNLYNSTNHDQCCYNYLQGCNSLLTTLHIWILRLIVSSVPLLDRSSGHLWNVLTSCMPRRCTAAKFNVLYHLILGNLKHTLKYIKGTMDQRFVISRIIQQHLKQWSDRPIPIHIHSYTDSDKSTSGYVISVLDTPLSLASRTQQTIYHSSAEGELMALGSGLNEAIHILQLLN